MTLRRREDGTENNVGAKLKILRYLGKLDTDILIVDTLTPR